MKYCADNFTQDYGLDFKYRGNFISYIKRAQDIFNQNNKINELPIFKDLIKTVIIPKIKQNKKK
jgi:hypothetical protein